MRLRTEFERSIKVTLYRIACASPLQHRAIHHKDGQSLDIWAYWMTSDWTSPEAMFLWAIYERAVYDYVGMGTAKHGFGKNPVWRNDTAETGNIKLPNGKRVNILEILGIEPTYAWSQLMKAMNYTKMKEAA